MPQEFPCSLARASAGRSRKEKFPWPFAWNRLFGKALRFCADGLRQLVIQLIVC
jgi:hypothetical protein